MKPGITEFKKPKTYSASHWWLILLLCCMVTAGFGQSALKGRVKNGQQELPNATVQLLGADSSLLQRVIADSNGQFVFRDITRGQYILSFSMVGYREYLTRLLLAKDQDMVLPDIFLEKEASELNTVVVRTKKPAWEQQIDRLVLNVQGSITATGSSVLELLQKSPGISINRQDNSISMNGKSGARIMINGKLQQLPIDVVLQMLDGMNAGNIEKIELITNPPSKLDAEGSAGIIHIVMKSDADIGTNGSFGLTLGYHWAETLGGNFNINHRTKKFAFFLDYSYLRNHNLHLSDMYRKSFENGFEQTVTDTSHRENTTTQQNLNAGMEWKITGKTILSLSLTGYRRNWDMDANNNDYNRVTRDSTVFTNMKIHESNIWQSATAGIGLQSAISSKSRIDLSFDYLYYHNNNPSDYDNKLFYQERNKNEVSKTDVGKTTPIRFLIAKADYQYISSPVLTLEAGIKGATSHLDNNVTVRNLTNGVWVIDSFFTSYSTLIENAGAVYTAARWQAGKKWQVNGGLRYEYTHTSISTPAIKNLVDRKYGYLFPSVSIKKDFEGGRDVSISYSRRITRPTYNDIAPFVFLWGPSTFSAGNTSLYPSITDAVKAGFHVKKWIVSLQYSHTKNEIVFLQPEKDRVSGNLILRSENLQYQNTLGFSNSWSFAITNWWNVQTNLTAQYQSARASHEQGNVRLHNYGFNANMVNAITLPKNFSVEISAMYQSRTITGISEYLPIMLLNAGVQKKLGVSGNLKLAVDDILYSNYWRIRTYSPENNIDSYFKYDFHSQFLRLTYTRNFGNNKLRSVKLQSGAEEERSRVQN